MHTTIGPAPPTCACRRPPPTHTHRQYPLQPSNTRTPELHAHRHVLSFVAAFSVAAFLFTCGSQSCTSTPRTHFVVSKNSCVCGCERTWCCNGLQLAHLFLPPLFAGGLDTSCVLVWLREQGEYHPVPQWGFSVCDSAASSALRSLALDSHSSPLLYSVNLSLQIKGTMSFATWLTLARARTARRPARRQ